MRIDCFSFIVILSLLCGCMAWAFDDSLPKRTSTLADYGWQWSSDSRMSDIPRSVRLK